MKILAAECSSTAASCALLSDGKIIASSFMNVKLTHSRTLLPMITAMLNYTETPFSDIDGFAISSGPGSFTGIRIGISLIKGFAAARNTLCVGVSTLEAIAQNYIYTDCIACCVMDARCKQVYNALFEIKAGVVSRITDDRALMCEELSQELLSNYANKKIIIMGDGTDCFAPFVKDNKNIELSCPRRRFQNAEGVALVANKIFEKGEAVTADKLFPVYLRLPQAERELKLKEGIK